MDRDVIESAWRMSGGIGAVKDGLKAATCMPGDRRTGDLLDSARLIVEKAHLAAWEYAAALANDTGGKT